MKKELERTKGRKRIIREKLGWGIFSKHKKQKFDELKKDLADSSSYGCDIDTHIERLHSIKAFCEKHLKDKYTDIIIQPISYYGDCESNITIEFDVILGRYETNEELEIRLKEELEEKNERERKNLKKEAEEMLRLQKKFQIGEGRK